MGWMICHFIISRIFFQIYYKLQHTDNKKKYLLRDDAYAMNMLSSPLVAGRPNSFEQRGEAENRVMWEMDSSGELICRVCWKICDGCNFPAKNLSISFLANWSLRTELSPSPALETCSYKIERAPFPAFRFLNFCFDKKRTTL